MINYVPERIYKVIKDDPMYKEIVSEIETKKKSCTTLKQWVESDSDEFFGESAEFYREELNAVIQKLCPDYLLQYKVNNGAYSKEELIAMYESKTYDAEYNFFFLSNIINQSYEDGSYVTYLDIFVKDYEKLSEDDKMNISNYVNLKYMYAKIYMMAYNQQYFGENTHVDLFNKSYNIYEKALTYTKDADTVNNYALEALADSAQAIAMKNVENDILLKYISLVCDVASKFSFQYENYSFSYAKLLDMKNMIYLYNRDYTSFLHGALNMYSYLSSAVKSPDALYNGLNYYDKCNHGMFAVLLRKYIKMKNLVPLLRTMDSATINNLPLEDYSYVISDIADVNSPSKENSIVVSKYMKSVDDWFSSNNKAYQELCAIKF